MLSNLNSTKSTYNKDVVYNKGMHEASTPLSVYSAILSYHKGGWFIDLSGNYYDRIYLSYAPGLRNGNTSPHNGYLPWRYGC